MTKCALLISGQPRSVQESYENIITKIIEPNNCDIFIHSWIDPEMVGKNYYSEWLVEHAKKQNENTNILPASTPIPPDIDRIILDCYNPKKYIFEQPKKFEYDPIFNERRQPTLNPQDCLSQLYSMFMANKLRKEYELENNITYDVIMRIRFGMIFRSEPIILKYYKNSSVCFIPIGFNGFDNKHAFLNHTSICDHFVISNSDGMDIYTDTFNHLEFLVHNSYCHIQNEDAIGSWVRKVNKIPVALLDIKYKINILEKETT